MFGEQRQTRTAQVMLFGVLAFVDLAGGVVAIADATQIRHGIGSQYPVTAHSLENTNQELSASTQAEIKHS